MNIGDYVRTKDGIITKIIDNRKNPYGEKTIFKLDKEISIDDLELSDMYSMTNPLAENTTNEIDTHFGDEKIIIKSSPNIIDLIQVGDYVNGYKVSFVDEEPVMGKFVQCDYKVSFGTTNHYRFYEADIKSIVTKEQFESMKYEVV